MAFTQAYRGAIKEGFYYEAYESASGELKGIFLFFREVGGKWIA